MKSTPRATGYQQLLDAGLTIRQAYYWVDKGYLHPTRRRPGSGRQHEFSPAELAVAALARRLVAVGFTVPAAFDVARGRRDLGLGVHVVLDAETPPVYQQLVAERFAGRAQPVHNTVDGAAA